MSNQIKSVARLIGTSYAHLQHNMDRAIEWGFTKMEEQAKEAPKNVMKKPKGVVGAVAGFARGFFGVIGEAGGAYYRTYEELKKKRK